MNIYIITPYFPTLDIFKSSAEDPRTKFLFYYAVEWVKQGHNVLLIHTIPKYPRIFSLFAPFSEHIPGGHKLQLKRFIQNQNTVQFSDYYYSGIHIIRIPIAKYIPHRDFLKIHYNRLKNNVSLKLNSIDLTPDVIISDFIVPSLAIAYHIKNAAKATIFQVLHHSDILYFKTNKNKMIKFLNNVTGILYRSYSMKKDFEKIGFKPARYDYMFSGIPAHVKLGSLKHKINKFIYVGALRYSKNVHHVIKAFAISSIYNRCTLEIIGSGPDEMKLKKLTHDLKLGNRVKFYGKISRHDVLKKMCKADCLVLVSKETFGMVYIEAMSQGCIVVGAKNQGIDGILIDGKNGFLAPVDDIYKLSEILTKISKLSEVEITEMSKNAIYTASKMTDNMLACNLLHKLKHISQTAIDCGTE